MTTRSICLLVAFAASTGSAIAQPNLPFRTPKTLKRTVDTVVLTGNDLGKIKGLHKDTIRVYVCRGGYMVPIPFQLDERGQTGLFIYTQGERGRRTKDWDFGNIDANDELVFLAQDTGDRAKPGQITSVPGHKQVQEVEISDPINNKGKGWIYVYQFPRKRLPGLAKGDLVEMRVRRHENGEKTHYWFGEYFHFNNERAHANAARATYAGMSTRPGLRSFAKIPSFIDSTQVKATVSFMWVTMERFSNDLKVDVGGYIDGPIRVIAENRMKIYLALGFWASAPDSYLILWRNRMSMPTKAYCPVNLDTTDISNYQLCVDLNQRLRGKGWRFFNSRNPKPVLIDGRMSPAEKKLDTRYPDWNCTYGPSGAMITKFVIPHFLKVRPASKLIYNDDVTHVEEEEGLEFQPGAMGYNGYLMDMQGLRKGTYPGDYLVWYLPPPFKPSDVQTYLNEYDRPLVGRASR